MKKRFQNSRQKSYEKICAFFHARKSRAIREILKTVWRQIFGIAIILYFASTLAKISENFFTQIWRSSGENFSDFFVGRLAAFAALTAGGVAILLFELEQKKKKTEEIQKTKYFLIQFCEESLRAIEIFEKCRQIMRKENEKTLWKKREELGSNPIFFHEIQTISQTMQTNKKDKFMLWWKRGFLSFLEVNLFFETIQEKTLTRFQNLKSEIGKNHGLKQYEKDFEYFHRFKASFKFFKKNREKSESWKKRDETPFNRTKAEKDFMRSKLRIQSLLRDLDPSNPLLLENFPNSENPEKKSENS